MGRRRKATTKVDASVFCRNQSLGHFLKLPDDATTKMKEIFPPNLKHTSAAASRLHSYSTIGFPVSLNREVSLYVELRLKRELSLRKRQMFPRSWRISLQSCLTKVVKPWTLVTRPVVP